MDVEGEPHGASHIVGHVTRADEVRTAVIGVGSEAVRGTIANVEVCVVDEVLSGRDLDARCDRHGTVW